ncbi:MAG: DUF2059 domain-containing protein [Bdellovibrionales bacterium]|nr:DUF2059 domain-containing protein [Bdellovibrionales bacterium]
MKLMILIFGILATVSAVAQSTHDKAVDQLFKSMDMEAVQKKQIENMVAMQCESNPVLQKIRPELTKFYMDNVGWKQLEPEMKKLYKKYFTEAEVSEINKFYQTPVGKKALLQMPTLFSEGMKLGQAKVSAKMPEFIKSVEGKLSQ